MKVIGLGSDHNGVDQKAQLIKIISKEFNNSFRCIDLGPYTSEFSTDYTDISKQIGSLVSSKQLDYGILICGTGVGMSIAANKVRGCRAALIHNTFSAPKSREHNNSNVLCLGSWVNDIETNFEIVKLWLNENFAEGRHVRRVEKIEQERNYSICFTYGCFDVLSTNHIKLLEWCKGLASKVIIGLTSDEHTAKIKGISRPYLKFKDRKTILSSLSYIDEVVEINNDLASLIKKINPDVIVKGGNTSEEEVRKIDCIPSKYAIRIFPRIDEPNQIKDLILDAK